MHKKTTDTFSKRKSPAKAPQKPLKNTKPKSDDKPFVAKKQRARVEESPEMKGKRKSFTKPTQDNPKPYAKPYAAKKPRVRVEDASELEGKQKRFSKPDQDKSKTYTKPFAAKKQYVRADDAPEMKGKRKSFTKPTQDKPIPYAKHSGKPAPFAKGKKAAAKPDGFRKRIAAPVEKAEPAVYAGPVSSDGEMRLNKYLSHAGIASRRKADELIKEGKVTVNGQVITEMGYKIKPGDKVQFDNQTVKPERKYYILLNKPKDFITTVSDERDRKTVMDLIHRAYEQIKAPGKPRLYPVGRLDRNTTGVLLITNDGELAQKLTHPSSEIRKTYHVVLDKKLRKEDFDKIAEGGVVLEDGIAEVDEIAYPNAKNRAEVGVEIHTGKNRFVRRIFEALGYEIVKLDRVLFAGLTKKDLPRGRWRFLSEQEVINLKHLTFSTR